LPLVSNSPVWVPSPAAASPDKCDEIRPGATLGTFSSGRY
jgi:hypothetical protein